jgi:Protein of unknown function (DUF1329)
MSERVGKKTSWIAVFTSIVAILFLFTPLGISTAAEEEGTLPDIPVGTVINGNNWQKYQQFLPPYVTAAFSGDYGVKLPPETKLVVGPFVSVPPPKKFREDTEHFAGTVTLKQLPSGGFVPENYVAGYPFPTPAGPNAGIEVVYNYFYQYKPWLSHRGIISGYNVDRFGNKNQTQAYQVNTRFRHISDPGMPQTLPDAPPGVFHAQYLEISAPEESKYFAQLTMFPDDPSKDEQVFQYIPSLRRSLRSSAASRCAPALGGDAYYDDFNGGFNGIPSTFHAIMRNATAKMLWIMPMAQISPPLTDYDILHWGFPNPSVGKWALHPVYEVELRPIPSVLPGYCYPRKVLWFDKQTYQPTALEMFDKADKFWKAEIPGYYPIPVPGGAPGDKTYNSFTNWETLIADFQLEHWNVPYFGDVQLNNDVPQKFRNTVRYATPGGLDQIMQ